MMLMKLTEGTDFILGRISRRGAKDISFAEAVALLKKREVDLVREAPRRSRGATKAAGSTGSQSPPPYHNCRRIGHRAISCTSPGQAPLARERRKQRAE
jgi:hypothetical protein